MKRFSIISRRPISEVAPVRNSIQTSSVLLHNPRYNQSRHRLSSPVQRRYSKMSSTIDTIRNTIAENFGGAGNLATHKFDIADTPDQTGKVAIVTGGSQGIGYGVTHTLLKHNIAKLFILSVSEDVVKGAKEAIAKELGQEKADRTEWIKCDMGDWQAVRDVARRIASQTDRLDILVHNAGRGIMTYELTDQGVDRHMAVNVYGPIVLTSALFPLLKKTAEKHGTVRIAHQASNAHQGAPKDVKFESLDELNQDLGPNGQYGRSKLALILEARFFNRHVTKNGHANILMNATHPGFVSTKQSKVDIHEPYPLAGYGMSVLFEPFKKDQFEGATPMIYAVTTPTESGLYICPPAVPEAGTEMSQDEELGERSMALAKKIIMEKSGGLKDFEFYY